MQLTNRNGSVIYFPGIFHPSQDYFNHLKTACCWQAEEVKVFGKWHKLRRQSALTFPDKSSKPHSAEVTEDWSLQAAKVSKLGIEGYRHRDLGG